MLTFKTANAAATTTVGRSQAAYKAVPGRSTSAIASGLNRLFGAPVSGGALSHEGHQSNIPGQRQEQGVSAAEQRRRIRYLDSVHAELDEYLEEPRETFTRTEGMNSGEQTIVFDILTYWQVRTLSLHSQTTTLTLPQNAEKRFPNLFCLAMDVLPAQASSVPCERLFSSGKETYTARRNRIQPSLMEALQVLKFSSRNGSLNLTEHLSSGFYPLEDESEICEALEIVYNTENV
jgi:hypothetical protein